MHNSTRATVAPGPSSWSRWLVLVFALLFGVVTTGQAAHIHPPGSATHQVRTAAVSTQSADSEEHCPLCVAMHQQALPAPMHAGSVPDLLADVTTGEVAERTVVSVWHFARFGRPPPEQT